MPHVTDLEPFQLCGLEFTKTLDQDYPDLSRCRVCIAHFVYVLEVSVWATVWNLLGYVALQDGSFVSNTYTCSCSFAVLIIAIVSFPHCYCIFWTLEVIGSRSWCSLCLEWVLSRACCFQAAAGDLESRFEAWH